MDSLNYNTFIGLFLIVLGVSCVVFNNKMRKKYGPSHLLTQSAWFVLVACIILALLLFFDKF